MWKLRDLCFVGWNVLYNFFEDGYAAYYLTQTGFQNISTQVQDDFEYEKPLGDHLLNEKNLAYNSLA